MAHRLNLSATGPKLCVIFLLLVSTSSSAQVVANWDWAHSLLQAAGGVSPAPSLQSQSICIDTNGNFYIAGNFLGSQLLNFPSGASGGSTIENFGSTTYLSGYMFQYDTTGSVIGSFTTPYAAGDVTLNRIITDKNNNIYITGTFDGTDFHPLGGPLMSNISPSGTTTDIFINKISPTGGGIWAKQAGGTYADVVGDICVDNNSNVYMTGNTIGDYIAFGTDTVHSIGGEQELFVTKYNSSGNVVWADGFGRREAEMSESNKICTDNNGYIYVAGPFTDTCRFGSSVIINPFGTPPFGNAIFLAKLDTNGNLVWLKGFYGNTDLPNIACNSKGEVYLAGYFGTATMTLDTFTLYNPVSSGNSEIFITKLDTAGNVKWAESVGGISGQSPTGIAIDGRDNGYLTGYFESSSMGFGSDTVRNAFPGVYIGFVLKFDSSGHPLYARSANPTHSTDVLDPTAIAANKRGDVYITGNLRADTVLCGSVVAPVVMGSSYYSSFTAKIDSVPDCVSSVTALSTTTFCSGDSVVLNATNQAGDTYQWFLGSTAIAGATNYHYAAVSGGIYSVNVTNTNACLSSASIGVTVNPLPALTTTLTPTPVCDSALFTYVPGSTVAGTGFEWSRAYVPGIYDLAATGSGSISETLINNTYVAVAVTYVYTLTAGSCTSTASVIVTVEPMPDPGTISGANNVCVGSTITMSDAVAGGVWGATNGRALVSGSGSVHGLAVGIDTVEYMATNSCSSAVASIVVTVNPLPNAGTVTGSDSLCVGDTMSLADVAPGGVWSVENSNIFLSGTGTLLGQTVGTDSVFYSVSNGCGTAKASLLVNIVNCTTGVKQVQAEEESVIIYPNPAQNSLTISASTGIKTVEISNLLGQPVFSGTYSANTAMLDIAALPGGIYLAKINGTFVRKFVKE